MRSQDHEPLFLAEQAGIPYMILFLFEPSLIAQPDTSLRHLQFNYGALQQLEETFSKQGHSLYSCYAEAIQVFKAIHASFTINTVFSYQESGTQISWDRDKAVASLFMANNITWQQSQREGVIRGISNRTGWDKLWYTIMHDPLLKNTFSPKLAVNWQNEFQIPSHFKDTWSNYPKQMQPPGEQPAWNYLKSFMESRGVNYMRFISKPQTSRTACGRISPYLAWGNLSVKQVYQYVKEHPNKQNHKRAYNGFLTRLKWRSHFIQKFEVECAYETRCINKGYESMQHTYNEAFIQAWKTGKTGYPMVDANMRCLIQTGWINFRMRAMLTSFFCHHLGQDWKLGVYHLAQLFLDYEPGIHYPQFQMQAGTTGINTVRMYNPVKQGIDHDPKGEFVKKWVPELNNIPLEHLHSPWTLTPMERTLYNLELGRDYPEPIVDLKPAAKIARDRIYGHRKNPKVHQEKQRILKTHTRNAK